jgi:hypothetical protein
MGEVFEDICKQWLWQENIAGKLPFSFQDCGRWGGANPLRKAEQEIDILAFDNNRQVMFCECKWTNEKMPESVILGLIEKSAMFNCDKAHYCLFSKSGFTNAALKLANDNVRLVGFDEMFLL